MEILVTIGIPVYNAALYIEKCVQSVLAQSMSGIELLFVDDKGSDDSFGIINRLTSESTGRVSVRVVEHEKNMGVAHARNTILREAKGKYLYFMDSDDWINADTIERLYKKAEQTKAETVWGSTIEIHANDGTSQMYCQYPDLELMGEGQLVMYECRDLHENLKHAVWNILYRTDFLRRHHLQFEQHGYFDDTIFHAKMQPLVERAVLMSDVTYNYYMRPASISNFQYRTSFKLQEAIDAIEASEVIIAHCKTLRGKSYFDVKCAKVMKQAFFMACGMLKHREQMEAKLEDSRIKAWLKYPASLKDVLAFRRYRKENLAFYMLCLLPAGMMVKAIMMVGKKKGFI